MILCRALSYEENTLDKSLLKNLSCKSTPMRMGSRTPDFMWTMAIPARILLMCDKEVIEV